MGLRGPKPGERPSGRQKGTPNRRTADLKAAVAAACGEDYDPVVGMARIDKFGLIDVYDPVTRQLVDVIPVDPVLRQRCAKEVAEYLHPKRKAIDISTPPGEEINIRISNDVQASENMKRMLAALDTD